MKLFTVGGALIVVILIGSLGMPPVRAAEPEHCDVVSNPSVIVEETNLAAFAVATPSPYWTASIPDATWIWSDEPVQQPVQGETKTFVKSFTVTPSYSGADLMIGADDFYEAFLNGTAVGPTSQEFSFTAATQDMFPVTTALRPGENTLRIKVTNSARADGTAQNNPGGLLYKMMITGATCGSVGATANTAPVITLNGESEQQDTIGAASYVDPGATATDAEDGSVAVSASGSVNTMIAGVYTLTYTAVDSGGLGATTTRTITITESHPSKPPVLDTSTYYKQGSREEVPATTTSVTAIETAASNNVSSAGFSVPKLGNFGFVCQPWLSGYIKDGRDQEAMVLILKLQIFLNIQEKAGLTITGVYDQATKNAVTAFQEKYSGDILAPWRIGEPTGWTYITTTKKVNELFDPNCAGAPLPLLTPFDLRA